MPKIRVYPNIVLKIKAETVAIYIPMDRRQAMAQHLTLPEYAHGATLFADVSGFTAMSETMDAEEVGATMNELWSRLDGAIKSHGGWIDKHIGDAVMALFGAPRAHENDPERAIMAALAMQVVRRDAVAR